MPRARCRASEGQSVETKEEDPDMDNRAKGRHGDRQDAQIARDLEISGDAYAQLKRLAHHYLRSYRRDMTLNCTALVHEAYLKLQTSKADAPESKSHYLAVASMAMRQILVDYVRQKNASKYGGDVVQVTLQESSVANDTPSIDLLALDSALDRLSATDPLLEKVVIMRFFGGFTVAETAEALSRSTRSVERDWTRARMYLYRDLGLGESGST